MSQDQGNENKSKRSAFWPWLLVGVAVLGIGVAGGVMVTKGLRPPAYERPELPALPEDEADPAVWGKYYPRHYDSYKKGYQKFDTKYGGSDKYDKLERMPYLRRVFAGYGFSEEYNEDRGHPYALEDVAGINQKRKPAAVCLTCKTAQLPGLLKKYGTAMYNKPFDEIRAQVSHPIGCADCHDPKTMALRITRPALTEAFGRQGKDIARSTRQEMRTLVCAQCHVEYYFKPGTREPVFPWDKGLKIDDIEKYYDEIKFKDFTHPDSGTDIVKIQHPDYEFFLGSTHQAAGVSCADCHMPFVKEGNVKITSHWWTSPLLHINQSCSVCHRQEADYLKNRVAYTQDKVAGLMNTTGDALVTAIDAIKAAAAVPNVNQTTVTEARALHRKAQIRFDWMNAENSMGFHNPQEGLETLARSLDLARQARATADRAVLEVRSATR